MDACWVFLISLPFLSLGLNVPTHAACNHAFLGQRHLLAVFIGFVMGLLIQSFLQVAILSSMELGVGDKLGYFLMNTLTYSGLAFGYFVFVNLNFASLRIRLLKEILLGEKKGVPFDSLLSVYNPKAILESRLERLVQWKQLSESNGRYFTSEKGFLYAAWIIDFLKKLIFPR